MELNIHDNCVYAHHVDYSNRQIILFTLYESNNIKEYTDIYFDDVEIHYFEQEVMNDSQGYANILFDIVEELSTELVSNRYKELFKRLKNYSWPCRGDSSPKDNFDKLILEGFKCFDIAASCGLSGFVFAREVRKKVRNNKFRINN